MLVASVALSSGQLRGQRVSLGDDIQVDQSRVKTNRRPPITLKAFEMVDPQTNKPVSPDTMIRLRDGRSVRAGDYYTQLNKMEKAANALGYTLRSAGTVDLEEVIIDRARLGAQAQTITSAHRKPDASAPPPSIGDAIQVRNRAQLKSFADRKQRIDQILSNPQLRAAVQQVNPQVGAAVTKEWSFELGDPSLFAVNGGVKLRVEGTANASTISGEARFGGALFNHPRELLRLMGSCSSPSAGSMNTQFSVFFDGKSVYNYNQNQPAPMEKSDSFSKDFDFPYTYRFSVYDVPMSATIGIRGTVGARYWFQLQPLSAVGFIYPSANVKGYAEAGPDLENVAKVQAGGDLTLLKDSMTLGAIVELKINGTTPPSFEKWYACYNDLQALSGDLYVKGCVDVPVFGEACAKKKLWDWQGVHTSGYVFISGPLMAAP